MFLEFRCEIMVSVTTAFSNPMSRCKYKVIVFVDDMSRLSAGQLRNVRPYIYTKNTQKKEKYYKGRIHEPAACIFRHTMQDCCKVF